MKRNKCFLLTIMGLFVLVSYVDGANAALKKPNEISACGSIADSGNYVLTQNLTATGNCLVVQADFVTINLSSYNITGDGTGYGIYDNGVQRTGIVVRDGAITNFSFGIRLASTKNVLIERMQVFGNTAYGAATGSKSIVKDSFFSGNGDIGLVVEDGSVVTGNVANNNVTYGIALGLGSCTVIGNVATGNNTGIWVSTGGATLVNNTANSNEYGFSVVCPSNLIGNTAIFDTNSDILYTGNPTDCNLSNNLFIPPPSP